MKNKIQLFIVFFIIIQFIFFIKSTAVEANYNPEYTNEQKAIREVADAYYRRGINAQYEAGITCFYSPEEATSQHPIHLSCSRYIFCVYYQALGIKLVNPTNAIIPYAKKYYNKDNIETNDVIEYWEVAIDENGNRIYRDNKGNKKNIDFSTSDGKNDYIKEILKELQVGDIISYRSSKADDSGHSLLVYDIIYDENGEPVDAIIRHATSKFERKTTKLTQGLSFANIFNKETGVYEGTIRECYLKEPYTISENEEDDKRPPLIDTISQKSYFSIIRPLLKDVNGNYTGYYYNSKYSIDKDNTTIFGYIVTRKELEKYKITEPTLSRLTYSGIFIEKGVDIFNNSVVNLGDTLEYTIKITNNSNTDYSSFDVIENISEYVEVSDNGSGNIQNDKITWNIQGLKSKESIEIKYKVIVKRNKSYLGKEIISKGTVAGVPSSTIKNFISYNLSENEKKDIKDKTESIMNTKNLCGLDLISEIYKETFGEKTNLNLENFDITDIIKTRNGRAYYPQEDKSKIYLNVENSFKNMILKNYYGALYTNDSGAWLKEWENATDLGERDNRADGIFKENFQTGDVLIYQNVQTANKNVFYQTENGTYYLIYISEDEKITIDGQELYGFIGLNENGEINNIYRSYTDYESDTDYKINDLRTLLAKDYYIILRPSMTLDLIPMKLKINYDIAQITNQDVTVTVTANEEILPIEGWNLSEDKKVLTKIYTENAEEELKISDYGGNEKTEVVKIENIDKEKPIVQVNYSTIERTLNDVIVTITSNEELQEVGGWQISDDKKVLTKTYTKNNEELITIYDLAGNSITETIKVENIDKEKLEYEIEYSTTITTNQDVTVTITANKEIQGVEGWILLEDKKTLIKTYTENAEEEITIKDLVGNSITAKIKISNIDKTISEMILPNTGEKIIFLPIVIFFILCIFGGIKLKKYKDIKKLYR